jgi:tyrosinase
MQVEADASIAGIHGRPYLPWDDVQATPGNDKNGYCAHTSVLFATWHRPYLALFEVCHSFKLRHDSLNVMLTDIQQVLYGHIQHIAALWPAGPDRDRYVVAAVNFRIPYWDWAATPVTGQSIYPAAVSGPPGISVAGPVGTQTIANPLFSYSFKPLDTTMMPDYPVCAVLLLQT